MDLNKILKKLLDAGTITAENVADINDSVTNLISKKAKPFEEQIKTLNDELTTFRDEAKTSELTKLGYDAKQVKLLKKLVTQEDGEDYETALKRTCEEFEITAGAKPPKKLDDANPPQPKQLPPKTDPKPGDGKGEDSDDGEIAIF